MAMRFTESAVQESLVNKPFLGLSALLCNGGFSSSSNQSSVITHAVAHLTISSSGLLVLCRFCAFRFASFLAQKQPITKSR